MELTRSWEAIIPKHIQSKFDFVETRNAASVFKSGHPDEFQNLLDVLEAFTIDLDRILRAGGNKHLIPDELDEAFRVLGWRETRFDQELTTKLVLQAYRPAGETEPTVKTSTNSYGGHKVDNVKGRIGFDVEWNPKDGNLDRDFMNFRSLYDGGAIDVGVILTRMAEGMVDLWADTIARAKDSLSPSDPPEWRERVKKIPTNPLKTSTTSNYERMVIRVKRGDAGGCPFLGIGITPRCVNLPQNLDAEIAALAASVGAGVEPRRLAQRMGLIP